MRTNIICAILLPVALAFGIVGALTNDPPTPEQVETVQWREPYGGCKEAYRYVGTPGWWDCLRHDEVRAWYPMTPLFARVLRQHYRQVNINERWMRCAYRFKGGTTVVLCPSGNRYSS